MALGGSIFVGLFSAYYIYGMKIIAQIFPFIDVLKFQGKYGIAAAGAIGLAYFTGCALPDIDIPYYPHGGHRIQSPMHNLLIQMFVYFGIYIALIFVQGHIYPYLLKYPSLIVWLYMLPAMSAGCLAHLMGDILQGGVGFGLPFKIFKKKRGKKHNVLSVFGVHKFGITGLKWQEYTESSYGMFITIVNSAVSFGTWAWIISIAGGREDIISYMLVTCFIIWFFSFVLYNSCNYFLSTSLAFMIVGGAIYAINIF